MDEIGARLREARMRAKVDLGEVETRTKIRAKYLRAMENEEWDLLPGEVYARSFLRTYAEFLGLDARELIDDFRRRYESPSDHEPPPIAPPSRERRERLLPRGPRRGVAPWLATAAVLVAVVVVLFIVGTGNTPSHGPTPRSTQASTRHAQTSPHRTVVRRAPARPRIVRLSLVPTGSVYVCLVNGAGRVLIPGRIYNVGETIPTERGGKLLLTLGTAAVTMKANGVSVPVTPSATAIGYEFTPTGHSLLPAARQPTCTAG